MPDMIIRDEKRSDFEAISEITKAAFETNPHSMHTEQYIINALRSASALAISLVAEIDSKVAGHIAFSPVTLSDGSPNWYGLGPISVSPVFQRKGIGKSLMHEGLKRLKGLGAKGCILVGDPNYYKRFGFINLPDLVIEGVLQENILSLPFAGHEPRGRVLFHEGFNATK